MKPYIKEEIEALSFNLNTVTQKLQSGELSSAGATAAEEMVKTLIKIKNFISDEKSDENRVHLMITKLPVLYFQIPKLN